MANRAMAMAQEHGPWREGAAWWVTGIQGVVLVIIGLFFLLSPASAGGLLLQLIALVLLAQCALQIVANLRAAPGEADPYGMLQAGIGATAGLLVALRAWLVPTLDVTSARTILGLGLLGYALVGVVRAFMHRDAASSWLDPIVTAILLVILAVILLTSSESNAADRVALLGWITLIGGVALLALAWRARGRQAVV